MGTIYSEDTLKRVLRKKLPDSKIINAHIETAYQQIQQVNRKKTNPHYFRIALSTAAVIIVFFTFCITNPALASKIPIIGRLFQRVENDISYKGDYSSRAISLIEKDTNALNYIQESNGIKITIPEVYYASMALYLAVKIENKEGFPSDFMSYDRLEINSTAEFDFRDSQYGKLICDPALGMETPYYIEGKYEDNHTFVGIIRVNLVDLKYTPSREQIESAGIIADNYENDMEYNKAIKEKFPWSEEAIQIPEEFTYYLNISNIWQYLTTGTEEYRTLPGEQEEIKVIEYDQKYYEGEWKFCFDVKLDSTNTQIIKINEVNRDGIGIGEVTKTAYEIKANLLLPEGKSKADYVAAICDANGDLLNSQGDIMEIYSTYGKDMSKVTIYICDEETYMNECRGKNKDNLPKKALYQTEVSFQ